MRRITFILYILFMITLLVNPILKASTEFDENQYGKIEATMASDIKSMSVDADKLITDMNLMIDAIDLKYGTQPDLSQGKLSQLAQLVTSSEDYNKQLKATIANKKLDIDQQYKKASELIGFIKEIHKNAESLLIEEATEEAL